MDCNTILQKDGVWLGILGGHLASNILGSVHFEFLGGYESEKKKRIRTMLEQCED